MKKTAIFIMSLVMAFVLGATLYAQRIIMQDREKPVVQPHSSDTIQSSPEVCKTPSPGGPIPIPYPNVAKTSDTAKGSKKPKCNGNPVSQKDSTLAKAVDMNPGAKVKMTPSTSAKLRPGLYLVLYGGTLYRFTISTLDQLTDAEFIGEKRTITGFHWLDD